MLKLRKQFLLLLVFGLPACSEQMDKLYSTPQPENMPRSPINAEALAVKSLLSYDIYVDDEILHAVFVAKSANPKHPYIGYLRSENGGQDWSAPVEID
jgi:hypothetical protein